MKLNRGMILKKNFSDSENFSISAAESLSGIKLVPDENILTLKYTT